MLPLSAQYREGRAPLTMTAIASVVMSLSSTANAQAIAPAAEATLDTVVVTASGYEQNIADAPASISVITRKELEKRSYADVVDAVQNIPGVFVTGGGASQDISIRGQAASYTLFLVDGRPVSAGRSVNTNGADGGKQIGLPPLSAIERIEVIRGPMSSLYGSEAMGGVVNIITRKATEEWHGGVSVELTKADNDISSDGQTHSAYVSGAIVPGLVGLKLNGAYTAFDESDYVGGDDNAESRPKSKRRQAGAELVLTPNKANTFGLSLQSARQETTKTPGKSVAATSSGSTYRYDKDVVALTHDGRYGDLMVNSYLQRDVSDKVQDQTKKETVTTLNSQATYLWGQHVVTFGGQYKDEELVNETNGLLTAGAGRRPLAGAVRKTDRWLAAVFGEVDWRLNDKFSLTTGLRYNEDENFGSHLSPRIYGVYTLAPEWALKGGVSTGYKQPTLAQSTAGVGSTTGGAGSPAPHSRALTLGNPNLDPESSTSIEFGTAFANAGRSVNASVMLFHTEFKDKIAEDRYCTSPRALNNNDMANWACPFGSNTYYFLSTYKNIDKALMQGVEATLDWRITPSVKLSSSYTYTHSEQKSGAFKGQPLNKQPKHMFNALLDWQATSNLSAWVQANYRSRTSDFLSRTSMSEGTPGYGLVDLGVVYRLSDATRLKAGIYNVADKRITNDIYGVVLDGRSFTVGLSADF